MTTAPGSRALVLLIAGTGVTVLAGGTAFACWTAVAAGTGTAEATTAAALTTGSVVAAPGLHPGGSATGSIAVTNPNPFSVLVTAATFAPAATTASACVTTGVTFTATTPPTPTVPLVIGPSGTATLSYTVSMGSEADDGCQGAVFTSDLSLSAAS